MSRDFKMACEKELQCHVHDKECMPLLCHDCYSMVCVDCLVTTHVGHKMCKISDSIEEKVVQLKDVVQKKESACFDLNSIQLNLQQRRCDIRKQKDQIIQLVTDRENEISRHMKKICHQTIEQISNLTSEIESPIMEDEETIELLRNCDFDMDTDQDCIKSFYFYKRLQLLGSRYKHQNTRDLSLTFVTPEDPLEKLTEIFGSVTADEMLSSDETKELQTDNNGTNFTAEAVHHHKKVIDDQIDSIISITPERSLLCSKGSLYHQSKDNVHKLLEKIEHFTYVPKLEEIIFTLNGSSKKICIWRQSVLKLDQKMSFMTLHCEEIVDINHEDTHYLTVLYSTFNRTVDNFLYKTCAVDLIDDTGCLRGPTHDLGEMNYNVIKHIKIFKSSLVTFKKGCVIMGKGLTFTALFRYSGSVGNKPNQTFSPIDLCADNIGNILIIDAYDSTVHLLDPKGKFQRVIMSREDGLCKITCIAIDTAERLWLGQQNGVMHFVKYDYVKTTTREKRRLEQIESSKKN